MDRKLGIGILVLCFGLSSVNVSLAAQVIEISPVVVQPYDLREISQQMLEQERINRDQELAIRGFIDDNQKITDTVLARQQEATLEKINQTMINYRDALLSRERARIAANGQKVSKYHDLITLTEDVEDMKGVGRTLTLKSDVSEEKYKILTELRDEMIVLDEKLKLGEMNQRIARLKDNLSRAQSEVSSKNDRIKEQENQIAILKAQTKNIPSSPAGSMALPPIIVNASSNQQQSANSALAVKDETIKQQGLELKAKDESIRWLNQVVTVAKNKAKYYQLTFQQDRLTMEQIQKEVQQIVGRLGVQLSRKQQQVDLLKSELENKITEANNQAQQEAQVQQDLKAQLQDKENQITAMKTAIQSGKETQAQSDQMTLMMSDYQKKLESKDNAYNQELRQVLLAKNDQAQMEKQIAYLNAQLQEKEAQVVKIKKEMYDLQELTSAKDRDLQAKNLSLSVELALARQKLNGMPGSDEINFLRTGLKVATAQLKQKDEMLSQIKANADEYEKEFKEQTREFQSLKDQLLMEKTSSKDRSSMGRSDLQKQVMILTQKLEAAEKKLRSKTHENKVAALEAQLEISAQKIKDLQAQVNQFELQSKSDAVQAKLKQALDKIDEQGRMINVLAQKLQDAGQSVDLTRITGK